MIAQRKAFAPETVVAGCCTLQLAVRAECLWRHLRPQGACSTHRVEVTLGAWHLGNMCFLAKSACSNGQCHKHPPCASPDCLHSSVDGRPVSSRYSVQVMQDLQLDNWEIKPSELEIMTNADGSQCQLGHGAFGQVM